MSAITAEEILKQRNDKLIASMREREFLHQMLESLTEGQRLGGYDSLDPQNNYEALWRELAVLEKKQADVEKKAGEHRMETMRVESQRSKLVDEIQRLQVHIEQQRQALDTRDANVSKLKEDLKKTEDQTKELEYSINVTNEKLTKADQIEMWRMRRMLRRLEIKEQMRDKWKAEAEKIREKARQVEMEELQVLAEEAGSKAAAIKRRCDVYAMVPTLSPATSSAARSTTTTTTTFTQDVSSKGVTLAADSSSHNMDWDPLEEARNAHSQARAPGSAFLRQSQSVKISGDVISALAAHTNPAVRAAARRVQQHKTHD